MFGVLQRIIGGSWNWMVLHGSWWFFGFGWFFTDPGGSSDLDGSSRILVVLRIWMVGGFSDLDDPRLILVVLRIWMVLHGCWRFFRTWAVFSGDTAVFQAQGHSTHTYISTSQRS
jgi:hypothetical protein